MHGMTPAAATVKKAAFGRSKSPADAGKKKRSHSGHPRVDRSVLTSPIPDSCKGKWFIQITLDTAKMSSSHLELAGEDFCLNSRHLRSKREYPYQSTKSPPRPTESPSPALLKGRELLLAVFEAFRQDSFPLGKAGMGLLLVRFSLAEGWNGTQKKQPSVIVITLGCFLVPRAGVEPARIAPLVFETSASTDSAIWATLSNNSDAKVRHFSELTNFFSEKRKNACAIRG